jgi:hypothetical protein
VGARHSVDFVIGLLIHPRAIHGLELQRQEATEIYAGIETTLLSSPIFPASGEANSGDRDSLAAGQHHLLDDIEVSEGQPAVAVPVSGVPDSTTALPSWPHAQYLEQGFRPQSNDAWVRTIH